MRALQPGPDVEVTAFFQRDADPADVERWVEALSAVLADDIVCIFHGPAELERRGIAGLRAGWLDWLEPWESYRTGDNELRALDDGRVLVSVRTWGRRREMTAEIEQRGVAIYTVRDGKVVQIEFFALPEDGFAAAGLD